MEFIDTHTHMYDEAYEGTEGQDAAVSRAIEAGVTKMIIPDVNSGERKAVLELCRRWPEHTYPCLGLHPTEVKDNWLEEIDLLKSALNQEKGIVAIGETGLDYHYGREEEKAQKEVFRAQIELSLEYGLPLVIHCREAVQDTLGILGEYRGRGLRGVFHAYSGSLETFMELDKYGQWSIGIGGVLTFKKANIADFVSRIPMDRILLETDSPYLTPVPYRGQRNESSYIPLIASFLAEKTGTDLQTVADVTSNNAIKLFRL